MSESHLNELLKRISTVMSEVLGRTEIAQDVKNCPLHICFEIIGADISANKKPIHFDITPPSSCGSVVLRADAGVWGEIFKETPEPGFQSIGALRRSCAEFSVLGSNLNIAQVLPLAERVVDYVRLGLHPKRSKNPNWNRRVLAQIKGHYLCIDESRGEWVYAERSGKESGPVLLMLHTAGADSRQWHGLMGELGTSKANASDTYSLQNWSMHAFDLPGHGRSPLPEDRPNWSWTLTEEDYCRWIISYLDACKISRATLIGCSMGSAIGLVLLAKYPNRFDGAVLLEAPYCSRGRRSIYLNHPQVHGARLAAAWVGSLLAPQSDKSSRDQATWIYSQGAPSVYDGDLSFYSDEFDAHKYTARIDTNKTPLWLMTGNYDYSASPQETDKIAQEVKGSHLVELKGFGHFPMIENPSGLIPYLAEPLKDILAHRKSI